MSIKWFRDSGRRVITPRRDNPKSPKNTRIKKPVDLKKLKGPGLRKPRVHLPFVKAVNYKTFLPNLSAAGISALKVIAAKNKLSAGEVRWILGHEGSDCPPAATEGALATKKLCSVLATMRWETLDKFNAESIKSGDGIWGMSHINCRCYISVRLFAGDRYALFEVYTDPAQGDGHSATSAAGYAWVGGNISESEISGLDFGQITDLNKFDSSDKPEREEAHRQLDRSDVAPAPAPAIAPEAPAAEEVPEPVEPHAEVGAEVPALTPEEEEAKRLEEERIEREKGLPGAPGI